MKDIFMKKVFFLFVSIVLVLPSLNATVYNGDCNATKTLKWSLDTSTGLLVISGTGAMTGYAPGAQPWYQYRDQITACRVDAGCTSMASNAFYGCKKITKVSYPLSLDDTFPEFECTIAGVPTITTKDATSVQSTTATINGEIVNNGGATITTRTLCWGTSAASLDNCQNFSGAPTINTFNYQITGLTANTTYYFRASATNEKGTGSGEVKSFTTAAAAASKGTKCDHDWVQLWTDGPKWATVNMGASTEYEDGDYYAFAETSTKTSYSHNNYAFKKNAEGGTSPYSNYTSGSDEQIASEHDAAIQNWGCGWRMPTKQEMQDLIDKCTWTWVQAPLASPCYCGYRITSKEAGNTNSIFLPMSGYFWTARWSYQSFPTLHPGTTPSFWAGYYGTSTSTGKNTRDSRYILRFDSKSGSDLSANGKPKIMTYTRSNGVTIRPVLAE